MLLALVATYIVVLGWLTVRQHARFGTFGFDMGIHDQGIWLLSRFERPFVTVRGLHYFGHHLNLVSLLFVPAYWLGAGPSFLYLVETVFLGLGAIPIYLLGRDFLDSRWTPLVPAAGFLLHPTLSWINWWHFHPEALAAAPLLLAVWFASRERWKWFAASIAFVLCTKEDLGLAATVLGAVLAASALLRRRRGDRVASWRPGAVTALVGVAWYLLATQVVMPFFSDGQGPFYAQEFFPQFGDDAASVVAGIVTQPGRTWDLLSDPARLTYYYRLLAPVGFIGLLGLPLLSMAGPQVAANALSSLSTTYDARYHYSVVPVAAVAAACVHGLRLLKRWSKPLLYMGLAVVAISSLVNHRAWAPTPAGRPFRTGIWAGPSPRHDVFDRAIAMVPDDAELVATYYLLPHLTHRTLAYEWPNPWIPGNWGFVNRDPHDPTTIDYLVLDLRSFQEPELVTALTKDGGEFKVIFRDDGVLVARRAGRSSVTTRPVR